MFNNPGIGTQGIRSLLRTGQEDLLIPPRLIRNVVGRTGGRLNTFVAAAEPARERYIMRAGSARKG